MPATPLSNWLASDPSRILGMVDRITRVKGRISPMMEKEELPDSNGFNFQSVVTERSSTSGGGWVDISTPNGTTNNCVPANSLITPATTVFNYVPRQRTAFSQDICFQDVRRGYSFEQQIQNQRDAFAEQIADYWDDEEKAQYVNASGHKVVFTTSLPESGFGQAIPATPATFGLSQSLLDTLYQRLYQDGAANEPYIQSAGAPVFPLMISMEGSRRIIKDDASVREDFRFADMGKGDLATLLKSWAIDKSFGGYAHVIDARMPRYNFVGSAYVQVPFYTTASATIGTASNVNPAYDSAEYEAAFIWHPKVIVRQVPKPIGSVGADTSGMAWDFNGEVVWRNIANKTENPFEDIGFYAARLMAAWKPDKVRYGYTIIYKRCPEVTGLPCVY